MKRRSPFSGELVTVPDPVPSGPDLATQLADLRVQLATEQARREAADARCTDLEARMIDAEQRAERIADDLSRAHGRIESLMTIPVPAPTPIPIHDPEPPVAFEAVVTKRDADGKLQRIMLTPMGELTH